MEKEWTSVPKLDFSPNPCTANLRGRPSQIQTSPFFFDTITHTAQTKLCNFPDHLAVPYLSPSMASPQEAMEQQFVEKPRDYHLS